ncbi:ABC transporter permease [Phyllobacterium sp. 22229]|nr:ABC transporter permease [Phyllobacterium myrsinacearum]
MSTEQAACPPTAGKTMLLADLGSGRRRYQLPVALGCNLAVGLILLFLVVPTLIVAALSFGNASHMEFPLHGLSLRWYEAYFNDPAWMAATVFSLKIAVATTFASTLAGTLAAIGLVRGRLPGLAIIEALVLGPLIIPHIVLGVALYLVFAPIHLTGNFAGFLIAHTVLAVPYVVINVSAALQRFDFALERAALSCGANRAQAFIHVVLPNILPAVVASAGFAFLSSFDEATVAFFLSDVGGKTVTSKMFEDIDFNLTPVIAAISTMLMGVSFLLMGLIHQVRRR